MELSTEYIAGLFDGEGCVGITRTRQKRYDPPRYSYVTYVTVQMADRDIIEHLHERFGGSFFIRRRGQSRKTMYLWRASANQILPFLDEVTPHLHIKKEQSKLVATFQRSILQETKSLKGKKKRLSDEQIEVRDHYYFLLRELKKQPEEWHLSREVEDGLVH